MIRFVDNTAGTSTTTGTGAYAISGTVAGRLAITTLSDGDECAFIAEMGSDFEIFFGTYTASGSTVSRDVVIRSSNSNAAVNWSAGTKTLSVVATTSMLTQWSSQFAEKPPGEPIVLAASFQSNGGHSNIRGTQTAPEVNNRVWDWSTDGTSAFDRADLAWRNVDPTDQYLYGTINVGTSRMVDSSGWKYTENIAFACANLLQKLSGRDVYVISVYRYDTALDDAEGWGYDPGSDNVLDVWSEEIANALAAPPSGVTFPASPDIVIFGQGESDAGDGKSSALYAYQLEEMILDCEDANRYGWADAGKTHWYVLEMPEPWQEQYQVFNGHAVADEFTPDHVHLVISRGALTYDTVHYVGESAAMLGHRVAKMALTGLSNSKSGIGAVRSKKLWVDPADVLSFWTYGGESASAPSTGTFNDNAAHTKLRIAKTDANPFGATDHSSVGFHTLHRQGCEITLESTTNAADYRKYTVETLPVDQGTYWEWDVTAYEEGGTPPTGATYSKLTSNRYIFDGVSVQAKSDMPIASGALLASNVYESYSSLYPSTPFGVAGALIDEDGILRRRGGPKEIPFKVQKSLNVTADNLIGFAVPNNTHIWARVIVVGANSTSHAMFKAEAETAGYRTTGAWQQVDSDITYTTPVSGFTLAWAAGSFNTTQLRLTTTGNAGETWDFDCYLEILEVAPAS